MLEHLHNCAKSTNAVAYHVRNAASSHIQGALSAQMHLFFFIP